MLGLLWVAECVFSDIYPEAYKEKKQITHLVSFSKNCHFDVGGGFCSLCNLSLSMGRLCGLCLTLEKGRERERERVYR